MNGILAGGVKQKKQRCEYTPCSHITRNPLIVNINNQIKKRETIFKI